MAYLVILYTIEPTPSLQPTIDENCGQRELTRKLNAEFV